LEATNVHRQQKDGSGRVLSGIDFDILHLSTDTERYAVTRIGLVALNTGTGHGYLPNTIRYFNSAAGADKYIASKPDINANENITSNIHTDKFSVPHADYYSNPNPHRDRLAARELR
jgi:hypothetical protein